MTRIDFEGTRNYLEAQREVLIKRAEEYEAAGELNHANGYMESVRVLEANIAKQQKQYEELNNPSVQKTYYTGSVGHDDWGFIEEPQGIVIYDGE